MQTKSNFVFYRRTSAALPTIVSSIADRRQQLAKKPFVTRKQRAAWHLKTIQVLVSQNYTASLTSISVGPTGITKKKLI